jgi:hypothetical protein
MTARLGSIALFEPPAWMEATLPAAQTTGTCVRWGPEKGGEHVAGQLVEIIRRPESIVQPWSMVGLDSIARLDFVVIAQLETIARLESILWLRSIVELDPPVQLDLDTVLQL